jgi:succinate dehydrogenase / fumarate reductase, cytochrome b subunit
MAQRPLSPHVFIYRFAYTMATSIFHRATGCALSGGLLLLVAWLVALASGADAYASFVAFAGCWPVKAVLALLVISFCYHFANGIRHLTWDAGIGMERAQARLSAKLVAAFVVVSAPLLIYLLLFHGATP